MTTPYNVHQHKCITCYFPIKDGEDEGFIREHNQMRYYHINWRDCQTALRNDYVDAATAEELQDV